MSSIFRTASARTRALALLAAIGIGGTLGACSSERAAEEISERVIEKGAGGDVDVDLDDDGVTIEGPDGSVTIDPDTGEIRVEGDDGTSSYQGSSNELPDGFPGEIPLAKGTITYGQVTTDPSGASSFSVIIESQDPVADVFDQVRSDLTTAGFAAEDQTVVTGTDFATGSFVNDTWQVSVALGAGGGPTTITYVVMPVS